MILYYLTALSLGIEGGYSQPALRFNNLDPGNALTIFVSRDFGITNISFSLETAFYHGKNPGYSFNTAGIRFGFYRNDWRFSPAVGFGTDYVSRAMNKNSETGLAFNYTLGLLINFHINRLRIYPKFYYESITDFTKQAGFIGIKLGLDYEM